MSKEKPSISLSNLSVTINGRNILNKLNLDIYPGDIVGYIGPNGAGKSTTMKVILGLINDYEGEIRLFDRVINHDEDVSYKQRIGYVPEKADMYDQLSAAEYLSFIGVMYGLEESYVQKKAYELLQLLEMGAAFHQRMDALSKGMRQKVLIVSSLLHDPDIIFLDEPLNGLDMNSVLVMKELFKKLAANGKTLLFTSHVMEVVENVSNRIVLLNEGNIVLDELESTIKTNNQSIETIFHDLTESNGGPDQIVDKLINRLIKKSQGEKPDE